MGGEEDSNRDCYKSKYVEYYRHPCSKLQFIFIALAFPLSYTKAMNVIEALKVTKSYNKNITAIDNLNLSISKGELHSLVGPNGSGKTTLIRLLIGSLKPTSGEVALFDQNPQQNRSAVRQKIGYMPQTSALYEELTARENLAFFGKLQHVSNLDEQIDEILDLLDLSDRADDQVHTFSGGMKTKVSLGCALIHNPPLLFLDEPTAAVDPILRDRIWKFLQDLTSKGTTIFLSTHSMDEALRADVITVLREGRIILQDTPANIMRKGSSTVSITLHDGNTIEKRTGAAQFLTDVLHPYGLSKDVASIEITQDTLEDVVISVIEKEDS